MQKPAISRLRPHSAMPISLSACEMMESAWILRSSHVASGPATGDFPECASAARALGVSSTFGVRETRVPRLNFVYRPTSPTRNLADPHSPDSKICSAPPDDERQVRDMYG